MGYQYYSVAPGIGLTPNPDDDQRQQIVNYAKTARSAEDLNNFAQSIGVSGIGNAQQLIDYRNQYHRVSNHFQTPDPVPAQVPASIPDYSTVPIGAQATLPTAAYQPDIMQQLNHHIAAGLSAARMDPQLAQMNADRVSNLLSLTPVSAVSGAMRGAGQAYTNFMYGHPDDGLKDAAGASLAALGAIPGEGAAADVAARAGEEALPQMSGAAFARQFDHILTEGQMRDAARQGQHLVLGADGTYLGSPGLTPATIGDWHNSIVDKLARYKEMGVKPGWYREAQDGIAASSDDPVEQNLMARSGAAQSPSATPPVETNNMLGLHNNYMITGEPGTASTASRNATSNAAYGQPTGNHPNYTINPDAITLGKKTGPYAEAKTPGYVAGPYGVNDGWMRPFYGLPHTPGKINDIGYTPAEHAFLGGAGINVLDDAVARGHLPPGSTMANMQEVGWMGQRMDSYMAKEQERYLAGKRKDPPNLNDALNYGSIGIGGALDRATGSMSREYTPGGGLGYLPGLASNPEANRAYFDAMHGATDNPRNSLIQGLQMLQRPGIVAESSWMDPIEGLQVNKSINDSPMLHLKPEMTISAKTGQPVLGGMAVNPRDIEALKPLAQLHGIMEAQHGVGINHFIPRNTSHKATQLNGLRIPDGDTSDILDRAQAAGLDVTDGGYNGGKIITKFNDYENPTTVAQQAKMVTDFHKANGKPGELGRFDSTYEPSGLSSDVGTGVATGHFLDRTANLPNFDPRIDASTFPAEVARRNAAKVPFEQQFGNNRPDITLFNRLMEGGIGNLRNYVKHNGLQGLPAWAGTVLAGGALTAQTLLPRQAQAQQGQ